MKQLDNYVNLRDAVDAAAPALAAAALPTSPPRAPFFSFARNCRPVRSSIAHFQLRNLLATPSRSDAYVVHASRLVHWCSATRARTTVIDASGDPGAPPLGPAPPGAIPLTPGRVQVGTAAVACGVAALGGFAGELIVAGVSRATARARGALRVTRSDNGITNAIDIVPGTSAGVAGPPSTIVAANNDGALRVFDAATLARTAELDLGWAVNCAVAAPAPTTAGPTAGLVAAVGDDPAALLLDPRAGPDAAAATVASLAGHVDYSFAAAWHPAGLLLATGNQDATARVWDARHTARAVAVLRSTLGAVRALRWSPDGRFLAAAEPADFVRVYDGDAGFGRVQELDFFGEVAGVAFSPCGDRLSVAVSDATYSSLLQFDRAAK
jgi:WD40 repeat protein